MPRACAASGSSRSRSPRAKLASDKDVPASIHDARRCLKRLRALLHLVRPGLDKDAYRREAEQLAAIGKLLSRARDRYVMQQTLAKLETQPGSLPKATATRLKKLVAHGNPRQQQEPRPRRRPPPRARASEAGAQAFQRQGHRGARARSSGRGSRSAPTARRARPFARPTPSRATRPSTPGARQRNAIGATCCCCPMAGRKRCRRGPARPRSCRACLGEDHDYSVLVAFAEQQGNSTLSREDRASLEDRLPIAPGRAQGPGQAARRPPLCRERRELQGPHRALLVLGGLPVGPDAGARARSEEGSSSGEEGKAGATPAAPSRSGLPAAAGTRT